VATNQDIKSWFALFNFLPSKLQVCTLSLFQVSLCVCVCVCSLSLSSLDRRYLRVCVLWEFFLADLQVLCCAVLVRARRCSCVLHILFFCLYVCLCVCVCLSLLDCSGNLWIECAKFVLFPSLCLLVPTFWKVWCFWKFYGVFVAL